MIASYPGFFPQDFVYGFKSEGKPSHMVMQHHWHQIYICTKCEHNGSTQCLSFVLLSVREFESQDQVTSVVVTYNVQNPSRLFSDFLHAQGNVWGEKRYMYNCDNLATSSTWGLPCCLERSEKHALAKSACLYTFLDVCACSCVIYPNNSACIYFSMFRSMPLQKRSYLLFVWMR